MRREKIWALIVICLFFLPIIVPSQQDFRQFSNQREKIKEFSAKIQEYKKYHTTDEVYEYAKKLGDAYNVKVVHPDSPEGLALISSAEIKRYHLEQKLGSTLETLTFSATNPDPENCQNTCTVFTPGSCEYWCTQYTCVWTTGENLTVTTIECGDTTIEFPPEESPGCPTCIPPE